MNRSDPSTADVITALSSPVDPALLRGPDLSRRRFLQAAGVAAGASLLPAWLADAAGAATPLGRDQGVLVLLTMGGGNDGLNTFIPVTDGAYHDARGSLAIPASAALPLSDTRGLNPNLPYLKQRWDAGDVAVIDGVGHEGSTLSHFVSMAQMMAANPDGRVGSSGWLGRVLDGLSGDPLTALSLGSSLPLLVQGRHRRAAAIPERANDLSRVANPDASELLQYDTIKRLGSSTGMGELADMVSGSFSQAIDLSGQLAPLIEQEQDEPRVVTKLKLAARLINANLGVRIISIVFGDFDSHANQATMHTERMQELNRGLEAFYSILHRDFGDRTLVVGTSEFGRRVKANATGTDHGTANSLFAIGAKVNGGFYGELPSLTNLDRWRNLTPTVDYRQLYGNLTSTWLGADSSEVLGRDWDDLGFLSSPGGGTTTTPRPTPVNVDTPRKRRAEVARLYLAYFLRHPDEAGYEYWVGVRQSGRTLAQISAEFVSSNEFRQRYGNLSNRQFVQLIYSNVLGRNADGEGLDYWTGVLDEGTTRGDVMVGFSESAEFRTKTTSDLTSIEHNGRVGRLYMAYFLRRPDEEGLDYWINTDLPTQAVSEQFAASNEFRNRYGSLDNRSFVNLVYRNVLGRDPDAGGLAHWLGVLNRGTSRGAVMQGFSDSNEFMQRVKSL